VKRVWRAAAIAVVGATWGGVAPGAADIAPVRELTVSAARAPARALEHSFLSPPGGWQPGNAAPLYYQAMLMLSSLSAEEQGVLAEVAGGATPAARAEGALERADEALALVEMASLMERCDWGTPVRSQGTSVRVPETARLRLVGMALAARANLQLSARDIAGSVRSVGTGLRLSRHIAEGPTIVQGVVALSIANMMADVLERLVGTEGAPSMYWPLAELGDVPVDISPGLRRERYIVNFGAPLLDAVGAGTVEPGAAVAAVGPAFFGSPTDSDPASRWRAAGLAAASYPEARSAFIAEGMTAAEVDALPVTYVSLRYGVQRYLELRDELFKWTALPYWQACDGVARSQERVGRAVESGEGGLLTHTLPNVEAMMRNSVMIQRRFGALRVIEALRLYAGANGGELPTSLAAPAMLPVAPDPMSGGGFGYERGEGVAVIGGITTGPSEKGREVLYRIRVRAPRGREE
jgi:hypothetical protein